MWEPHLTPQIWQAVWEKNVIIVYVTKDIFVELNTLNVKTIHEYPIKELLKRAGTSPRGISRI